MDDGRKPMVDKRSYRRSRNMSNKSPRWIHAYSCRWNATERHLHILSGLPLKIQHMCLCNTCHPFFLGRFDFYGKEGVTNWVYGLAGWCSFVIKRHLIDLIGWDCLPLLRLVRLRQYEVEAEASHPRGRDGLMGSAEKKTWSDSRPSETPRYIINNKNKNKR